VTYPKWFLYSFILFLLFIPVVWWGLGTYLSINWTQAAMISGIYIGSVMLYVELTSDNKNGGTK